MLLREVLKVHEIIKIGQFCVLEWMLEKELEGAVYLYPATFMGGIEWLPGAQRNSRRNDPMVMGVRIFARSAGEKLRVGGTVGSPKKPAEAAQDDGG